MGSTCSITRGRQKLERPRQLVLLLQSPVVPSEPGLLHSGRRFPGRPVMRKQDSLDLGGCHQTPRFFVLPPEWLG
jgi:hypothetical protein